MESTTMMGKGAGGVAGPTRTEEARRKSGAKHAWMAMGALCLVSLAASGITWNTLSLFADPIVNEWGIMRTQYQIVPTLIAGLNMVMSMFAFGALEARFGIRKLMTLGLVLMGVAMGLIATANGLVALYAAAVLWGIGLSWEANSMRNSAVMQWFAKRQATMISIVAGIGQGTGIVFAALFGYIMLFSGWRPLMWVCCAVCLACAGLCFFLYKGKPEDLGEKPLYADEVVEEEAAEAEEAGGTGISFAEMMRSPRFYILCVAWVLLGIAGDAIMANLVLIAIDFGFSEVSALSLSVCLLASCILSPVGGWACDKFGSRIFITVGMVLLIGACAVLRAGAVTLPMLFVIAVILGNAWNTTVIPAATSTVEAFGDRDFEKKNTLFVAMQCLGVAIAPTFFSAFYDFGGGTYDLGYVVVAVLAVITIALFFVGTRRGAGDDEAPADSVQENAQAV